jgi:predicted amidophosphoribosyltransferase
MKWLLLFIQSGMVRLEGGSEHVMAYCAQRAGQKEKSPDVAATIITYMYSPRHHACIPLMEYKMTNDGVPFAQIMARNMATNQQMKGYAEIYLVPIESKDERLKAVNFLFEEYSK